MATRALKLPTTYRVCISQSERLIAAVGRNVVMADLVNRKRLSSTHPLSHPAAADFSPDDSLLAVKSTWGEIAVLSTEDSEKLVFNRPRRQDEGTSIHFSSDGDFLVDGSWSGEVRVRRTSDLAMVETFSFKGEMINSVSRNSEGDCWLFGHKKKASTELVEPRLPYLTLWNWPLQSIDSTIDPGLKTLEAAALAPTAPHIAVVGFCNAIGARVLRILTLTGEVLATTPLTISGTGSSTRWSHDSKFVATVANGEFLVFSAPELNLYAKFVEEYPSDIAFLRNGSEVVLGSWSSGCIANLPTLPKMLDR